MQSQLTVRLPEDLDREVSSAKRLRLKRSDIVRLAPEQDFLHEPRARESRAPYGR